jgi:hypothetical protein
MSREWIPNPIENHHISGRAACIGSTTDIDAFDFTLYKITKVACSVVKNCSYMV